METNTVQWNGLNKYFLRRRQKLLGEGFGTELHILIFMLVHLFKVYYYMYSLCYIAFHNKLEKVKGSFFMSKFFLMKLII